MKKVIAAIVILMVSLPSLVQSQTQSVAEDGPAVLAVVNGVTITLRDIEKNTGDAVRNLQRQVTEARKRELDLLINSKLLAAEAKKRGVSTAKLLEQEVVAKVTAPTPAEAQTFYDQNKARIQGDFNSVKDEILRHLFQGALGNPQRNGKLRLRQSALQSHADDMRFRLHFCSPSFTRFDLEYSVQDLLPYVALRFKLGQRPSSKFLSHLETPPTTASEYVKACSPASPSPKASASRTRSAYTSHSRLFGARPSFLSQVVTSVPCELHLSQG